MGKPNYDDLTTRLIRGKQQRTGRDSTVHAARIAPVALGSGQLAARQPTDAKTSLHHVVDIGEPETAI